MAPAKPKARERIEALTETPQIGRIYTGKVVRIADFGAFVEILPNIDGMVHISQLDYRAGRESGRHLSRWAMRSPSWSPPSTTSGKIRLSRQAVLEGWTAEEALEHDRKGSGGSRPRGGRLRWAVLAVTVVTAAVGGSHGSSDRGRRR